MAAAVLTLVIDLLLAGSLWLLLGARFQLDADEQTNSLLNLAAYYLLGLPVVFLLVFVVVG